MKCAKVIVFYFGSRRSGSNNTSITNLLPEILYNELKIDKGTPTDTFFVVNLSGTSEDHQLDKYNGLATKNGFIRVLKRDNIGLSFGGYLDTFNQHASEYDYWFFVEDDVIVYKEGYVQEFIKELNNSEATFVALSPINTYIKPHCGGGCGLTSTKYMKEVYNKEQVNELLAKWSDYTSYNVAANSLGTDNAEIEFSSRFKLINHSKYSPICINYAGGHKTQKRFVNNHNINNLEFIYKVGA